MTERAHTTFAPGKAILFGEYAVLHGAPALSVAVDRGARAWIGAATPPSPFVEAARAQVGAVLAAAGRPAELPRDLGVDSGALYEGEQKLGLGSSAAVTAAVCGALFAWAGLPLEDRRRLFEVADQAHGSAAARGSGIDVATAVWGGAIRFQRLGGEVQVTPTALPAGAELTFIFCGKSASTPELLGRVRALAERDRPAHDQAIEALVQLAGALTEALSRGDAAALCRDLDAYGLAMERLGEAAGAEIVTPEHARLAAIARRHGGAAKPSGAGGGDLGVALSFGPEDTRRLRAACLADQLIVLALGAPAPGLRLENS